jgi:phosphoenolpyruvate-protein phosphotransferase
MNFLNYFFNTPKPILTQLTVTSKNGFHLRPIARFIHEAKQFESSISLVTKSQEVPATQVPTILALGLEYNDNFQLKTQGKDAAKASEYLTKFFQDLMQDDKEIKQVEQDEEHYEADTIEGTSISKGIAIGTLVNYVKHTTTYHREGNLSFEEALTQTAEDLDTLYETNKPQEEAQIFLAQKALLASDLFQKNFANIDEEMRKLENTKFQSRTADYRDLKKRIESHMGINTEFKLPDESIDSIVVAEELFPSEVEELSKMKAVKGVILNQGSTTSHVAILLRSFNIPSMIAHAKIDSSGEYYDSILDASAGVLVDVPSENDFEKAQKRQEAYQTTQNQSFDKRFEPTQTKAGKTIKVLANITDVNSAKEAKEQGAEGVGLLRTEFLFTEVKPTVEEQTQAYSEIFELFDEITVRTLDIGGDKSLPYINIEQEDNPFLGVRGIRFSLQEQTLFKEQLLAVGLASANAPHTTIKIMFPMISTTEEFIKAKNIAQELYKEHQIDIHTIQFGIMLEVPSVIFALKEFDKLVDFYSIGTNDLTQYLFAIERTHPTLTTNPTSPILMNALKQIIETTNKPISICGELAGLEEVTKELTKMGYDTLSVSSNLIPNLKERIRHV